LSRTSVAIESDPWSVGSGTGDSGKSSPLLVVVTAGVPRDRRRKGKPLGGRRAWHNVIEFRVVEPPTIAASAGFLDCEGQFASTELGPLSAKKGRARIVSGRAALVAKFTEGRDYFVSSLAFLSEPDFSSS
jgi:hypothetical protein